MQKPRPSFNFYIAQVPVGEQASVYREAVERSGQKFVEGFNAYKKTLGLERATPKQAWSFFHDVMDAAPGLWEEYKRVFPDDFERDQKQYQRLRDRAIAGDFEDAEEPRNMVENETAEVYA